MPKVFFAILIVLAFTACQQSSDDDSGSVSSQSDYPQLRVSVSEALVFRQPSRDSAVLLRLIEGDETPILAQTPADSLGVPWYQVGLGEQFGWIAASQVDVTGNLEEARTVQIDFDELSATLVATEVTPTPASQEVMATVSGASAIVFAAPDRLAEQVSFLVAGETATVIGQNANPDDTFYYLARNGVPLGWVLAGQVSITGDIQQVEFVSVPTATSMPIVTGTPSLTPTPLITQADTPTITPTIDLAATVQNAPTATTVPLGEEETPDTAVTEIADVPAVDIQEGVPPPLEFTLPDGWQQGHVLVPLNNAFMEGNLPISIYEGDLSNGVRGFMWIFWGFPNVIVFDGDFNLYGDGVQLLRGVLFPPELNCQIGLGPEVRQYEVGGLEAEGTIYSAVACDAANDIAGFFAALQVEGMNYAFFVGVEPPTATDTGLLEMQTILDSVVFNDLQ